jgi:hypothetical protein
MQSPGNGVDERVGNGEGESRPVSKRWYLRLTILVIVVGLTIALFLIRDHIQGLASLGYLGAFIATLASSATILVPIPGIVVVFVLGNVWNPLAIGLVSGLGSGLGELTGYAAGYSGQELFQGNKLYSRIAGWVERRASSAVPRDEVSFLLYPGQDSPVYPSCLCGPLGAGMGEKLVCGLAILPIDCLA